MRLRFFLEEKKLVREIESSVLPPIGALTDLNDKTANLFRIDDLHVYYDAYGGTTAEIILKECE